ncbi:MAG: hypothetical protein SwStaBPW_16020 [Shewanella algae]
MPKAIQASGQNVNFLFYKELVLRARLRAADMHQLSASKAWAHKKSAIIYDLRPIGLSPVLTLTECPVVDWRERRTRLHLS